MMHDLIAQLTNNQAAFNKLRRRIQIKRKDAKRLGIETMPFDHFLKLALASPHWRKLGRGKDLYCFCRRDHTKGYTPENTFIGSFTDNIRERLQRCGRPPGRGRPKRILTPPQTAARAARARARSRRLYRRRQEQKLLSKNPKDLTTTQRAARRRAQWRIYNRNRPPTSAPNQEQPARHNASQTIE